MNDDNHHHHKLIIIIAVGRMKLTRVASNLKKMNFEHLSFFIIELNVTVRRCISLKRQELIVGSGESA